MMTCAHWILIGAAGRNVGKTEFACELIRRESANGIVIAVKITTVKERNGCCPRGGKGCGVCTSLEGNFCITEETVTDRDKDTSRMLKAGAEKVFWLRVLAEHLEEGAAALMSRLPAGVPVVCESNSIRRVLKPGLFLVIREKDSTQVKDTCRVVMDLADRILEFSGQGWNVGPDRVELSDGRWWMKPEATAVILAGGGSRRMGTDKGLLELNGRPMIQRIADQLAFFPERLVGANDPGKYAFLGLPVIADREAGKGPLMGLLSCMERATHDLCFVTGCDIPVVDRGFVMRLLALTDGHDIVMARSANGMPEPLLAVYRKTVLPFAETLLARGERRFAALLDSVRVRFLDAEDFSWYRNLNTMEDYRQWRDRAALPAKGGT